MHSHPFLLGLQKANQVYGKEKFFSNWFNKDGNKILALILVLIGTDGKAGYV